MKPTVRLTDIKDLVVIEPVVFADDRGYLFETYHQDDYDAICPGVQIAQTYQSRSAKNVLRGLHYQKQTAKIVRCTRGLVFDVAIDIRKNSPTFGQWYGLELSEENHLQLYVPAGFAHGFLALSDIADVHYHQSKVYTPEDEGCIIFNDPDINVDWPTENPLVSDKDIQGISLEEYQCNPSF